MPDISVSDLQAIAVDCTTKFLNNGVPLSTSLAKQASDRGLNYDQLQRAVEATNTLTHLKTLEIGGDRTQEFPLADTQEIIKQACLPEGMAKQASTTVAAPGVALPDSFEKRASLAEQALSGVSAPTPNQATAWTWFTKQAAANERKLEDLRAEAMVLPGRITKLASQIKQDPAALEKLAKVCDQESQDFDRMCGLVFGEMKTRPSYSEFLFTKQASGLDQVQELRGLVTRAYEVQAGIEKCASLKKEADLTKKAFAPLLARLANSLGKGVAGAGVGLGKLAVKPITATASAVKNAVAPAITQGVKNAKVTAANSSVGQALGMQNIGPVNNASIKKKLGTIGVLGGAALDASSYTPKVDPAGDMSGSVWAATQPKL